MMQKENKLTASEVAITTATIEVRVLQIGKRQFTYAVFDQLIEEAIIDPETGKLCGVPWGWVNRHNDCKEITKQNVEHLHIIWQKGNELRKAIAAMTWQIPSYLTSPGAVPKSIACSYFQKAKDRQHLAEWWLQARVLAGERFNLGTSSRNVPATIAGHQFEIALDYRQLAGMREPQPFHLQQFRKDLLSNVGTIKAEEIEQLLLREVTAIGKLVTAWEKSYKKLALLEELYLAV